MHWVTLPAESFLCLPDFGVFEKDSRCMNRVRSLLSMGCMLLGLNFKPRLGTAGSVMNIGLSINGWSVS